MDFLDNSRRRRCLLLCWPRVRGNAITQPSSIWTTGIDQSDMKLAKTRFFSNLHSIFITIFFKILRTTLCKQIFVTVKCLNGIYVGIRLKCISIYNGSKNLKCKQQFDLLGSHITKPKGYRGRPSRWDSLLLKAFLFNHFHLICGCGKVEKWLPFLYIFTAIIHGNYFYFYCLVIYTHYLLKVYFLFVFENVKLLIKKIIFFQNF